MKKLILTYLTLLLTCVTNASSLWENETTVLSAQDQFPISPHFKSVAKKLNKHLSGGKFFDTSEIVNTEWVKKKFGIEKSARHYEFYITTDDRKKLLCSFFRRGSNKVVVVGPGFTNDKEKMAPFVHIYQDYDVLIMNFREHGEVSPLELRPWKRFMGIDFNSTLGTEEFRDAFAVVKYLRSLKYKTTQTPVYEEIIGHGVCYGAYIFAKAQGIWERYPDFEEIEGKLFDKLILDGCWYSLEKWIKKIAHDPWLIVSPQKGGWNEFSLFKSGKLEDTFLWLTKLLFGVSTEGTEITHYVQNIKKTPVLFFYGKDDLTIDRDDFMKIWSSTGTDSKTAIITSNPHVINHIKEKELYALICEIFVSESNNEFVKLLRYPQGILERILSQFQGLSLPLYKTSEH